LPQRIAILPPFRMDRNEVTVGRWRDALARGFTPPAQPAQNPGQLDFSDITSVAACTWSTAPMGRETLPLNCVQRQDARAFCQFLGGDLPTEAEWEYVAMDAGREVKTRYAWGDEEPTCQRAVWGRQLSGQAGFHSTDCNSLGVGAAPVDAVS